MNANISDVKNQLSCITDDYAPAADRVQKSPVMHISFILNFIEWHEVAEIFYVVMSLPLFWSSFPCLEVNE